MLDWLWSYHKVMLIWCYLRITLDVILPVMLLTDTYGFVSSPAYIQTIPLMYHHVAIFNDIC